MALARPFRGAEAREIRVDPQVPAAEDEDSAAEARVVQTMAAAAEAS